MSSSNYDAWQEKEERTMENVDELVNIVKRKIPGLHLVAVSLTATKQRTLCQLLYNMATDRCHPGGAF